MDSTPTTAQQHHTPQEIWDLIHATSEQMKETDRKRAETERILEESRRENERALKESRRENERALIEAKLETERALKEARLETERALKEARLETERVLKESKRETDRKMQEVLEQRKRTEMEMEKLDKQLSRLDNNWGRFLEELCAPAAFELFKRQGINITQRYQGPTHQVSDDGKHEMEVDIILCNTTEAVAVEVKNTLRKDDIDRFRSQLAHFKDIFHPFTHYRVYAAIAAVNINRGLIKYAVKQGFYVIVCSGEGVFKMGQCPDPDKRLQV